MVKKLQKISTKQSKKESGLTDKQVGIIQYNQEQGSEGEEARR